MRLALALVPVATIAKQVGVGRERVSDILSEPEVEAKIAKARAEAFKDAQRILREGTRRAAEVMTAALESKDPRVSLRAAVELLSKAGADAPKRGELTGADGAPLHLWDPERARAELAKRIRERYPDQATAERVMKELLG